MIQKKNEAENLEKEKPEEEKSEEFLRFEEGLKLIFSLSPEEARRIREMPVPPDPDDPKRKRDS